MAQETRDESRRRYASTDEDVRMERMMTEIVLGGTKETSLVVDGDTDAQIWDGLAASIAAIPAGGIMIYGWPYWED